MNSRIFSLRLDQKLNGGHLHLKNDGTARKDLVLRLTTEPAFAAPVEVRLQSIEADGEFRVAPLDRRYRLKVENHPCSGKTEAC